MLHHGLVNPVSGTDTLLNKSKRRFKCNVVMSKILHVVYIVIGVVLSNVNRL